jgi:hypothetical protein
VCVCASGRAVAAEFRAAERNVVRLLLSGVPHMRSRPRAPVQSASKRRGRRRSFHPAYRGRPAHPARNEKKKRFSPSAGVEPSTSALCRPLLLSLRHAVTMRFDGRHHSTSITTSYGAVVPEAYLLPGRVDRSVASFQARWRDTHSAGYLPRARIGQHCVGVDAAA